MKHRLRPHSAVLIAVVGMWTLGSLGTFLVIRFGEWSMMPSDNPWLTIAQIGAFYSAFFGARIPAAAFVALIITSSSFQHPIFAAALVTVCCELLRFGIQFAGSPWFAMRNLEWWIPVGFESAGITSLTLLTVGIAWMIGERKNRGNCTHPNRRLTERG